MARNDSPPFDRGATYYGGGTIDLTDTTSGSQLEGKEFLFEDLDYSAGGIGAGARPARSGKHVRCRVVRNASGTTLYAKRLLAFKLTGGSVYGGQVDGCVNTTAGRGYPADEFLGAAGVQANDLFYVVVQGPAMCKTDYLTLGANIAVGDMVVAGTFATSTNTTSGGLVQSQDLTGATSVLAAQVRNAVGTALSARTTAQTASDILVDVGKW